MRLEGLKVIITGGAYGLGAATAELFASHSCQVAIWDIDAEAGEKYAAELEGRFYRTDIRNLASIQESFIRTVEDLGRTDVVVNCAAIACCTQNIEAHDSEVMQFFDRSLLGNVYGSFFTTALAANQMASQDEIEGERGVIVNVSNAFIASSFQFASEYLGKKGVVTNMNLPVARDLAAYKIRLNTISPGHFSEPDAIKLSEFANWQGIALSTDEPNEFAQIVAALVMNRYIAGINIAFGAKLQ